MGCKVSKKYPNTQKKHEKMHFFAKIFGQLKKKQYLCSRFRKNGDIYQGEKAEIAQLVEHDLAKVGVAGSSPVFRSKGKSNVQNSGSAFFSEIY